MVFAMPVRSIPRNARSITGRLVCARTGKLLEHESLLERDFLLLLALDPAVSFVEPQPVRIRYVHLDDDNRPRVRQHIPDVLVRYHDRRPPMLVEVKYLAKLRSRRAELLPKIRAGVRYARERGWRYRVYTDQKIRGVRLNNARFLMVFRREPRDAVAATRLLSELRSQGKVSVEALIAACADGAPQTKAMLLPQVWRLIAAHEVGVDLDRAPLSLATALWPLSS